MVSNNRNVKLGSNSNSAVSFWSLLHVARVELRTVIGSFRFWLVLLLLSGAALSAFVLSCLVYINVAPYNVSYVGGTPLYLLGNLDPAYFVFFQAGLLLLVFDFQHRVRSNRLEEVLESKPITNLEFVLGRTLCYSVLVWLIVFLNVLLMQFIGLGSQLFKFDIAHTIQLHSMFNLLVVDAPVALLFWTTLMLLLTKLLGSRLLILLASVCAIVAYYLWVLNTPYSFVDLLSHSSNQTLFISDTMPAFPLATSWIMRIGALLIAVALLTLGVWFYQRADSTRKLWIKAVPLTSLGVGVLVLSAGVLYELSKSNEVKSWREAHLTYEWSAKLDVQTIQGEVAINPRRQMHIDLNMDFVVTSQTPTESLVFTLNPGYQIDTIEVDESSCEYEFDEGILEVSVPFVIEPETRYSLKIVAAGRPKPHFAYLNTPYDYLDDINFPIQAVHSYGTDGSIYNSKFVALMPGVYWYPIPGTIPRVADDDSFGSDFFEVELTVQLDAPSSWKVAGPGTSKTNSDEPDVYLTKPNIPVASIGLFASEYVRMSHDFGNVELAMYLHSHHLKNYVALERYKSEVLAEIDRIIKSLEEHAFPIPYSSLVFVEVPNKLRTIGGGWRMGRLNSLPGVILLKERGFPTMNIDQMVSAVEDTYADRADISKRVWSNLYYASEKALGNENLDSPIRDQIWGHLVSVSGEHRRALDLIFHVWMGRFTPSPSEGLFSVYASAQASRMTGVNLPATKSGEALYWKEGDYGARPSVRNLMERTALVGLAFSLDDHQQDFEVLYQKSKSIYQSLFSYFNYRRQTEDRNRWLSELRRRFEGQRFTYNDVMVLAREFDIDVDLFLDDWLTKDTLPGFEVSPGTSTRISNSTGDSPRYLLTFDIANTQTASGFVYTYRDSLPVFVLEGNTSKRLTILRELDSTDTDEVSLTVDTGLSLNRGSIGLVIPTDSAPVDESLAPVDTLEESDFVPQRNEIIVDDLDGGFEVHQPRPLSIQFRFAPRDWFWVSTLQENFDGTLPDIDWRFTILNARWVRRFEKNAYGKFRRTVANSRVSRSLKLHPIRFIATVPDTGQWSLDFYVHQPSNRRQYGSLASFILEIENSSNRWKRDFTPDSSKVGWKFVDDFELAEGRTDVVLVGVSKPSLVYADAIRWRKTTKRE